MNGSNNIVNSVTLNQRSENHNVNRKQKASEVVIELAQAGVTLKVDEERKLLFAPQSLVIAKQCKQLKLYKKEIVDYLDSLSWSDDWEETDGETVNSWCLAYEHPRGWKSIYGDHLICGTCYSPISKKVVAEWIQRE